MNIKKTLMIRKFVNFVVIVRLLGEDQYSTIQSKIRYNIIYLIGVIFH